MATQALSYSDNIPGPFFVDQTCIACDTCAGIAPGHFQLTQDCDHAIVMAQPTSKTEIALCQKALEKCPVQAIGEIR